MSTPHHEHIATAFLQLSFAIKLWIFLEDYPIDKEKFDTTTLIQSPENCVELPRGEFHTYQDLQLASENNISIAFGAAAITLWEAIREHNSFVPKKINPQANTKENLVALSYMLRCCFAHGSAIPVWSILNEKYKTKYRVGNKTIDLSVINNGDPFNYGSIGGYKTLWLLRDDAYACKLI